VCPDKMTAINSVLGPIDTSSLGFTLMHEHLVIAGAGIPQDFPESLGDRLMERIVAHLIEVKKQGIKTIVDATTLDLGRDVTILAEASRLSGVNVITVTGWWLGIPPFALGLSANQLAKLFIREIREGISGTNIKAGILKAATDEQGINEWQEAVLRGVARAHLETNVPIMLHSYPFGDVGKSQLSILKEEGVNLKRVKMDHSNDTTDLNYLKWLLDQGCYLGLDRYPGHSAATPQERTRTMKALIDAGYVDRLLPSHDCLLNHVIPELQERVQFYNEIETNNPYGFNYINKVVIPQLREMGVPETVLSRLCVVGPRNFFEGI
jgi:phosphotriesterase-related protein